MSEKKFEEAMKRLEHIVASLEKGNLSLDESLKMFEEGMKLLHFCSRKLEEAEEKVTVLIKESGAKVTQQPFEVDEKEDD